MREARDVFRGLSLSLSLSLALSLCIYTHIVGIYILRYLQREMGTASDVFRGLVLTDDDSIAEVRRDLVPGS